MKTFRKSFLEIFDAIEKKTVNPRDVLGYIFVKLDKLSQQYNVIFDDTIETSEFLGVVNINTVLTMLDEHFALKYGSRLPVIAIYTAYEHLLDQVNGITVKFCAPLIFTHLLINTASVMSKFGMMKILRLRWWKSNMVFP